MRRNWLITIILGLVLVAFPSVALADADSDATLAEEQAALEASIFQDVAVPEPAPAPEEADGEAEDGLAEIGLGTPQPNQMSCTAELDCTDGNVISCTGDNSCSKNVWEGTVTCDGDTTRCPNWCKATLQHTCGSCGSYNCSCTSLDGDCSVGVDSVTCDGFENPCYCPIGCCPNPPTHEC